MLICVDLMATNMLNGDAVVDARVAGPPIKLLCRRHGTKSNFYLNLFFPFLRSLVFNVVN